jgi:hypothetical protein
MLEGTWLTVMVLVVVVCDVNVVVLQGLATVQSPESFTYSSRLDVVSVYEILDNCKPASNLFSDARMLSRLAL